MQSAVNSDRAIASFANHAPQEKTARAGFASVGNSGRRQAQPRIATLLIEGERDEHKRDVSCIDLSQARRIAKHQMWSGAAKLHQW